ncbi:hypothetical protein FHS29_000069 [Saccharothrix tamanrassetensis]|uniref:Uncharacterized protein n=1 Tax=Saccharothrix tamanrassetensis TaxID=1051531 RepID=A0A841C7W6_9PSEU|nr:hypothetical protein [Saccharothrix tamanrassetensis]MBB5953499.1 hypothetical protein [Saccharothrix tamanrassetensis]
MSLRDRTAVRPGRWATPLLVLTGWASVVFTVGTAVHAFVVVDEQTLTRMMVLAGADPGQAPGFLIGFRVVGCLYLVGNALGVLALRRRPSRWLFWVVLVVNGTQAAGVLLVPPEVFTAAQERFGVVGLLPSLVTDVGALVLVVVLVTASAITRATWGQVRGLGRAATST